MMALYAWVADIGLRLAQAGYWMICHRMQFAGARVLRAGHRMMHLGFVGGLRRRVKPDGIKTSKSAVMPIGKVK